MAVFKKAPHVESGEATLDGIKGPFDAITAEMAGQFAATYWPVILGGIILFVLIFRGHERMAIMTGGAIVALQAWRLGVFG